MSDQPRAREDISFAAAARAWAIPFLGFGAFEVVGLAGFVQGVAEHTWWMVALSILGLVLGGRILMKLARGFALYRRGQV